MNQYVFVLGNAVSLCEKELLTTLDKLQISYRKLNASYPIVCIETASSIDSEKLIFQLGGTIKIAKVEGVIPDFSEDRLISHMAEYLGDLPANVGLSNYTNLNFPIEKSLSKLKQNLADKNLNIRYVAPKKAQVLSSVVVKKQKVVEFIVVRVEENIFIARTLSVQDSDEWSHRDYGRPYAAPKTGMLPLKVARMMVNIAANLKGNKIEQKLKLFDPFCGMGTILSEAMVLGHEVVGMDVSKKTSQKAQKNLEWLLSQYPQFSKARLLVMEGDAVHASNQIAPLSIDVVVTEPFMGQSFEKNGSKLYQGKKATSQEILKNMFGGLTKLYTGALKDWFKILKPEGIVVIVLPQMVWQSREYSVKKMVDMCEKLGYTKIAGPFEYARTGAIIRRQIYCFRKNYGTR